MREVIISNCEKSFIQDIVSAGHRLDGRIYNESRKLDLSFGSDYGSCLVSLGETKILAQVSCEVVQPKQIRPNEGNLTINLEISTMAGPQFESNRQMEITMYLNRLLEKCYKDSKCIDLESLCIVVEEKVWSLRVDIKVLNHAGNLIECASIATLASLAHFKRPDITRSGESVIIHSLTEKDPIPTVLYHYPACITYAIFNNDILISDPTFIEESVCMSNIEEDNNMNTSGSLLVVGMNQYKELCLIDLSGAAIDNANIVNKAMQHAADRCKEIVDIVKNAIISDDVLRRKRVKINFGDTITNNHILSMSRKDLSICLTRYNVDDLQDKKDIEMIEKEEEPEPSKYDVVPTIPHTVEIIAKKAASMWIEISSESEHEED